MSYLFFSTRNGLIKKTDLTEYQTIKSAGIIGIKLAPNDEMLAVAQTSGDDEIMLVTSFGKAIRFNEEDVRSSGRATMGVRGIRLKREDDLVVAMDIIKKSKSENRPQPLQLLIVSERGYGKRTRLEEYDAQGRGGGGVFAAKVTEKTGKLIGAKLIDPKIVSDLVVISELGQVIRLPFDSIPVLGRQTQGVRLINLENGDKAATITPLQKDVREAV